MKFTNELLKEFRDQEPEMGTKPPMSTDDEYDFDMDGGDDMGMDMGSDDLDAEKSCCQCACHKSDDSEMGMGADDMGMDMGSDDDMDMSMGSDDSEMGMGSDDIELKAGLNRSRMRRGVNEISINTAKGRKKFKNVSDRTLRKIKEMMSNGY